MPTPRLLNLPPEVLLEICEHLAAPMQDAYHSRHLYWSLSPVHSGIAFERTKLANVLACGAPLARLMRTCRAMHSMAGHELYSCYYDMLREALFPDLCLLLNIPVPARFVRRFRLPWTLTEGEEDISAALTGLSLTTKSGMCVDFQNDSTPGMNWSDE
ncbi:hypothetical protein CNYM01_12248 [Colletotrichum nymphaeae SA-01]|uniref:Uncharacterized protein n=1 Tax=Colletotrichum nymphaeae SA-01 TaxID=1460502 RepID=A0A135SC45_9PEZI|nr:hypothetical protein CNYM01_12248 [Colletotrichum nymphaeae SA-01]